MGFLWYIRQGCWKYVSLRLKFFFWYLSNNSTSDKKTKQIISKCSVKDHVHLKVICCESISLVILCFLRCLLTLLYLANITLALQHIFNGKLFIFINHQWWTIMQHSLCGGLSIGMGIKDRFHLRTSSKISQASESYASELFSSSVNAGRCWQMTLMVNHLCLHWMWDSNSLSKQIPFSSTVKKHIRDLGCYDIKNPLVLPTWWFTYDRCILSEPSSSQEMFFE